MTETSFSAPPPDRPSPAGSGAHAWLPTLLVGALAVLAMGGAVFLRPSERALGSAETEAIGHLWGLWCAARGVWEHGPLVRDAAINYPEGFVSHLMDPVNLLLFLPPYWLAGGGATGATLGWNLLHAATPALGAWGCWRLGRRLVGDHPAAPWAIALLTAVFCLSPYLLQVPFMGRTEYLPAVLYPWHLALLHAWLRNPAGMVGEGAPLEAPPSWHLGVGCGLVLGAIALGGWYLAVFTLLLEAPLSLWLARRLPWREQAWRLGLVALVGVLCALPAALALLAHPPDGSGAFLSGTGGQPLPELRAEEYPPVALAEIFRLSGRRSLNQWMDQAPYVGVVSLWLCALGVYAFRRRALGWVGVLAWALALAAGPLIRVQGAEGSGAEGGVLHGPVYWLLQGVDSLRPLRSWSRVAVLAALPAGVGAMYGYLAVAPRERSQRALLGLGLIAAALIDQGSWPKYYAFERPSFEAEAPADLLAVLRSLPPGPVVNLPIDTALREGGGPEMHGHFMLWQLQHERPVPTSFRGVYDTTLTHSAIARHAALAAAASVSPGEPARRGERAEAVKVVPVDPACARADAADLRARGYVGLTLQADLAGADGLEALITGVLGAPTARAGRAMAWDLTRLPPGEAAPEGCALPELPSWLLRRGAS